MVFGKLGKILGRQKASQKSGTTVAPFERKGAHATESNSDDSPVGRGYDEAVQTASRDGVVPAATIAADTHTLPEQRATLEASWGTEVQDEDVMDPEGPGKDLVDDIGILSNEDEDGHRRTPLAARPED